MDILYHGESVYTLPPLPHSPGTWSLSHPHSLPLYRSGPLDPGHNLAKYRETLLSSAVSRYFSGTICDGDGLGWDDHERDLQHGSVDEAHYSCVAVILPVELAGDGETAAKHKTLNDDRANAIAC